MVAVASPERLAAGREVGGVADIEWQAQSGRVWELAVASSLLSLVTLGIYSF